jgi:hypothetical protein
MATIRFLADWSDVIEGPLQRDNPLVIDYAPERAQILMEGTGEAYGVVTAYVKFQPGGETHEGLVVAPRYVLQHAGLTGMGAVSLELQVPSTATDVEVWFQSHNKYGSISSDPRHGQNYRFKVE